MEISEKTQHEAEETFHRIDKNADRIIDIEEFAMLMLEIDHRCTAAELRTCFDTIDADGDGCITVGEFCAWRKCGADAHAPDAGRPPR